MFILSDEFANPLLETTKYINKFIHLYKKKAKDNINNDERLYFRNKKKIKRNAFF